MNPQTIGYQLPAVRVRPDWAQRLWTLHRGRVARLFALHFNINDYILDLTWKNTAGPGAEPRMEVTEDVFGDWADHKPPSFREYLHILLFAPDGFACQAVYTYTLASGMLANDRAHQGMGQPLSKELGATSLINTALERLRLAHTPQAGQDGQSAAGAEVDLPTDVPSNLRILGHMLRQRYFVDTPQGRAEAPIAVVLDYAEKLIPYHVGEGQGTREQLQALETVQSWALDPQIRDTRNIIILLTTNRGSLAANVFGEGSGARELRVPLPDKLTRWAFIKRKRDTTTPAALRFANLAPEFAPQHAGLQQTPPEQGLAGATQGMRLMDIDGMNREAVMAWMGANAQRGVEAAVGLGGAIITPSLVQKAKAESIERQSVQLLEIVPPERGFTEIGGMSELKRYLSLRTAMMRTGANSPLIPSGLLLAGPPGTGKTIIAEALAKEGGFNLVKMRNIQDRWVGSSERNLDMVLSLLKDLHPVVVFVDEIDQAMGHRDTGQNGDSGVSGRMFSRVLEEMSNASNRGKILWVAATNRTDILDDALLRRFDRVVPLLMPDANESRRIFATMPRTIAKQSGNVINVTYGGDLTQSSRTADARRPEPTESDLEKFRTIATRSAAAGLTGAEIEIVVRRAVEMAQEEQLAAHLLLQQAQEEMRQPLTSEAVLHRALEVSQLNRQQKLEPSLDLDDAIARQMLDVAARDMAGGRQNNTVDLPPINSRHLQAAMDDFKINHNPTAYDHQSLLAIRSCNFYSVLPNPLPNRPIFQKILNTRGQVDPGKLDQAIDELAQILTPTRRSTGGGNAG